MLQGREERSQTFYHTQVQLFFAALRAFRGFHLLLYLFCPGARSVHGHKAVIGEGCDGGVIFPLNKRCLEGELPCGREQFWQSRTVQV